MTLLQTAARGAAIKSCRVQKSRNPAGRCQLRFAKDRDITYPLLADPESRAINAFKIRNTAARGRTAGIPHPGTFIIGKDGRIVARLAHDGYRERHTSAQIIEAAGK